MKYSLNFIFTNGFNSRLSGISSETVQLITKCFEKGKIFTLSTGKMKCFYNPNTIALIEMTEDTPK